MHKNADKRAHTYDISAAIRTVPHPPVTLLGEEKFHFTDNNSSRQEDTEFNDVIHTEPCGSRIRSVSMFFSVISFQFSGLQILQ